MQRLTFGHRLLNKLLVGLMLSLCTFRILLPVQNCVGSLFSKSGTFLPLVELFYQSLHRRLVTYSQTAISQINLLNYQQSSFFCSTFFFTYMDMHFQTLEVLLPQSTTSCSHRFLVSNLSATSAPETYL